jgi:2-dehydropantoate 2-reductase
MTKETRRTITMHSTAVIGAGATGAYLAARFADAGIDVSLVARGVSADAIKEQGITLHHPDGTRTTAHPARVLTSATEVSEPVDLVLFCVKGYDTTEAAALVGPLLGATGKVLCLQNGVKNEQILAELFGEDRVLSGVLYIGSERTAPGVISCASPPRVIVGPYGKSGGTADSAAAAELFERAAITVTVEPDISRAKWEKFVFNCGLNPLTALTGARLGTILSVPQCEAVFEGLIDEALAVGFAAGAPLEVESKSRVQQTAARMDISSSMAEDLAAGRPMELDSFSGYVAELGRRHGVPTPFSTFAHGTLLVRNVAGQGA